MDPRFRKPIPDEYKDDLERQTAYHTFGDVHYGRFYNPHVTICRLSDPKYFDHVVEHHGDRFDGHSWEATEFWLSRKEKEWELVKKFNM